MLWSSIFSNNFSSILSLLLRFYSQLHVSLISKHIVSAAYLYRCVRLPNKAWIAYQKSHPRRKLTPFTLANINCQLLLSKRRNFMSHSPIHTWTLSGCILSQLLWIVHATTLPCSENTVSLQKSSTSGSLKISISCFLF